MPPPKCHSEKDYICNCDRYSMILLLRLIWPHTVYYMELSQGQIINKSNKQELSSMFITHCLNIMHASVNFQYSIWFRSYGSHTVYYMELSQGQMIKKTKQARVVFLFHKYIYESLQEHA